MNLAGEPSTDAPVSSYKYEPEIALCKPTTDVVLIGHAHPPGGGATQVDVGIKVGPVQKVAKVFGDRFWVMDEQGVVMSRTAALGRVATDLGERVRRSRRVDRRPSVRCSSRAIPSAPDSASLWRRTVIASGCPTSKTPNQLIGGYGAVVAPCGFGFTSPNWQPRAGFAGTYDEQWNKTRKPMLPLDFDRRFFNAAAPGLVAPGYLRGDEDVVVLNATSVPRLAFRLPGVPRRYAGSSCAANDDADCRRISTR